MGKGRVAGACVTCSGAWEESYRAGEGRGVRTSLNDTKFRCAMLRNLDFILNAVGKTEEC